MEQVKRKKVKYVYVAGPYTKGNPVVNTASAVKAGDELLSRGFFPYVPHLTLFWDFLSPHSWDEWMKFDEAWILKCDALIRLPGDSRGADREVAFAEAHKIPVFHGLNNFLRKVRG